VGRWKLTMVRGPMGSMQGFKCWQGMTEHNTHVLLHVTDVGGRDNDHVISSAPGLQTQVQQVNGDPGTTAGSLRLLSEDTLCQACS
jgi:hypothetical protein